MRIRPRPERRRRGAALLLSLLAVLAVGAISATISRIQSTMEGNQRFSVDRRAALYVAEAGMAEATLAVSQGKSGEIASEKLLCPVPLLGSRYQHCQYQVSPARIDVL